MGWRYQAARARRAYENKELKREAERRAEAARYAEAIAIAEVAGYSSAMKVCDVPHIDLWRFQRMSEARPSFQRQLREARERVALLLYTRTGEVLNRAAEVLPEEKDLTTLVKAASVLHEQALKAIGEPTNTTRVELSPDQALERLNALLTSALPEPAIDVEYTTPGWEEDSLPDP